jgi:CheY-like chemotaxis protein/HPt (histidine-containing phosphotransfer) domain-containing protein
MNPAKIRCRSAELDPIEAAEGRMASKDDIRVLLVEDHPVNQKVVSRMLEQLACAVDVVGDGLLGVQQAQRGYDLILMDCSMPRMDGFEATREIRTMSGRVGTTPIVALTAHATEEDRKRCLDAGMDGWIAKPVSQDQLVSTLRQHTHWSNAFAVPTPGILHEATVRELLVLGGPDDPEFFESLVQEFAHAAEGVIAAAREHVINQEIPELRRATHRLAGAASTIGATRVRGACAPFASVTATDLPRQATEWLASVEREVALATKELLACVPAKGGGRG